MWCLRVSYRHWPQSGDRLEVGGRAGHVREGTGRNLHTEEHVGGPGGEVGLGESRGSAGHALPHVLLQGAGHAERHLTEPALVDVLPHPPVSLHMSEANIVIHFNISNQCIVKY